MEPIWRAISELFARAHPAVQASILVALITAVIWFSIWSLRLRDRLGRARRRAEAEAARARKLLSRSRRQTHHWHKEAHTLQRRFERMGQVDSDVWLRRPQTDETPPFVPLDTRGCPIVCFLNLKGGVGKTTLVANLAGALATGAAGPPRKVLAIDLDNQGTLSNLCVGLEDLRHRRRNDLCSDRLLEDPPEKLGLLTAPMTGTHGAASVLVAREELDRSDFQFQARFFALGEEVRFHHRRRLHEPNGALGYDLVLYDCPPRLTTSAINALMAADYLVIPTGLHPNDIDAVPRMLRWLVHKFAPLDAFHAQVLGIVCNRTYRAPSTDGLTRDERFQLDKLVGSLKPFPRSDDLCFRSAVPDNPRVGRSVRDAVAIGTTEPGHEIYGPLAGEFLSRMGGFDT